MRHKRKGKGKDGAWHRRREVIKRVELKTKGSGGVCDRGGEVIFCSAVSFQKGLAGQSRCATGREEDNREIAASGGGWK